MIRYPGAGLRRSSNSSTPSAAASWLSSCDSGLYCPCSSAASVASSRPLSRVGFSCRRLGRGRRPALFPLLAFVLFLLLFGFGVLPQWKRGRPGLWDEASQGQRLSLQ